MSNQRTEEKKALFAKLLETARVRCRDDFHGFVQLLAPLVLPEDFKDGRHIRLICDKLMAVERGDIPRLMLMMPPGSMKTVLVNKLFVSWCLGRHPTWQILSVSHTTELSERFGRDVRDLISSDEYEKVFPATVLRKDVRAAGRWYTTKKGVYTAAGAGTSIAGMRANLGILDDVLSEQSARSENDRRALIAWYPGGFRTRLLPGARVVMVGTRWHHEDLQGWLLEQQGKNKRSDQWEVIKIPALLDDEGATLLGLPAGESYWPEMWSTESMEQTKANTSAHDWSALYEQNPTPEEGALFKAEWFKEWPHDAPPNCSYVLMSLDTAFSKRETADYSVVQVWGIFHLTQTDSKGIETRVPHMLLLSSKRGRWEYPELRQETQKSYDKFKPDVVVIEKKASGQSLIQDLQRAGLPVREFMPDRDKISRANAITPILASGRLWVPRRLWGEELIHEALQFPLGGNDDQVDAMSQAVLFMREGFQIGTPEEDSWNQAVAKRRKHKGYMPNRQRARIAA